MQCLQRVQGFFRGFESLTAYHSKEPGNRNGFRDFLCAATVSWLLPVLKYRENVHDKENKMLNPERKMLMKMLTDLLRILASWRYFAYPLRFSKLCLYICWLSPYCTQACTLL